MIISERIFKILRDKNMSQNAFAKQVGLASSTISDWKTKKRVCQVKCVSFFNFLSAVQC